METLVIMASLLTLETLEFWKTQPLKSLNYLETLEFLEAL